MKPTAPSSSGHEALARTGDFEVLAGPSGAFTQVVVEGRYTDELQTLLQRQVLPPARNLAVDVLGLAGITMPLALRGFFKLLGAESNALWRHADRESCWVRPFRGVRQEDDLTAGCVKFT